MKKMFACVLSLVLLTCFLTSCGPRDVVHNEMYCNLSERCEGFSPISQFKDIKGEIVTKESVVLDEKDASGNKLEHYHLFVQWEEDN